MPCLLCSQSDRGRAAAQYVAKCHLQTHALQQSASPTNTCPEMGHRQEPGALVFRQSVARDDPLGRRCARRSPPSRIRRAVAHRQCGAGAGLTWAYKVTLLGTLSRKPRAPCHCWRTRGCHSPRAARPDVLRRSCHAANLALVAWRPVDQTE
jgi:hypothetical protein